MVAVLRDRGTISICRRSRGLGKPSHRLREPLENKPQWVQDPADRGPVPHLAVARAWAVLALYQSQEDNHA